MTAIRQRWESERHSINCVAIARELFGRDPVKTDSRRAWFVCAFHEDHRPSLSVETKPGGRWKCWSCGVGGDAADLIQRFQHVDFTEARAQLLGIQIFDPAKGHHAKHSSLREAGLKPSAAPAAETRPRFTTAEAEAFHAQSVQTLAGDRGRAAQDTLAARKLTAATVDRARLGYAVGGDARIPWKASGVVIPWYWRGALAALKLRCDDSFLARFPVDRPRRPPRYLEIWRHPDYGRHVVVFPDLVAVDHAAPVILVEGELDCLLVAQEIAGLSATALTAGATSMYVEGQKDTRVARRAVVNYIRASVPWLVGLDNDEAGESVASLYIKRSSRMTRVIPPEGKDWTEAAQRGVNLREFFTEELKWAMEA